MKKTVKGYVLGFLSAILLAALATSVYAAATARTRTLTVTYGHIRLVVNGELVTPRDGQGNVVHPFVSAGTTYLPVRALADALGQEVRWDGATNTVYIGSNTVAANTNPNPPTNTPIPTPEPPVVTPQPPARQFNMNDPNVRRHPIFATATSPQELQANAAGGWWSAGEIIAQQQNDHPDYLIGDQTFYEWRMVPIRQWLDSFMSARNISIANMTDYEKTAVIRRVIDDGLLEEFIGLWRPGFRHHATDCVPRAEAIYFMMIAMDFEMFRMTGGHHGTINHSWNAYWDSTVGAVRFLDANPATGMWNAFVDELHALRFTLSDSGT